MVTNLADMPILVVVAQKLLVDRHTDTQTRLRLLVLAEIPPYGWEFLLVPAESFFPVANPDFDPETQIGPDRPGDPDWPGHGPRTRPGSTPKI